MNLARVLIFADKAKSVIKTIFLIRLIYLVF